MADGHMLDLPKLGWAVTRNIYPSPSSWVQEHELGLAATQIEALVEILELAVADNLLQPSQVGFEGSVQARLRLLAPRAGSWCCHD